MQDFDYLNGVSSAKQSRLLSEEILLQLSRAEDFSQAVDMLKSASYNALLDVEDYSQFFDKELQNLLNFIKNECKNAKIVRFFTLFYDYDNIEAVVKSRKMGYEPFAFIEAEGDYSVDNIKSILRNKDYTSFHNPFIISLCQELDLLGDDCSPRDLNYVFDKYKYLELSSLFKCGILKKITDYLLDCENICTAYRAKSEEEFLCNCISLGNIKKDFLLKLLKRDFNINEVSDKNLSNVIALLFFSPNEDFYKLEQIKARQILAMIKENMYISTGPEVFLYYVFSELYEIKNLRMIFALQKNNLKNKIKNRLLL